MSKSKKFHDPKRVTILDKFTYKNVGVLTQCVDNVYQFILYHNGEFYSSYNVITSEKALTNKELTSVGNLVSAQAKATVDMLLARENGDDLLQKNEQGAAIVEELDKAFAGQKPHRT